MVQGEGRGLLKSVCMVHGSLHRTRSDHGTWYSPLAWFTLCFLPVLHHDDKQCSRH